MDEVWNFAGTVYSFVENTSWVKAAFPFGESPCLIHFIPTHKFSGLLTEADLTKVNVNTDNSLINSDGTPSDLAKYYFNYQQ